LKNRLQVLWKHDAIIMGSVLPHGLVKLLENWKGCAKKG
jgi:hypothetical protein